MKRLTYFLALLFAVTLRAQTPSAVTVSADGQELTVTFSNMNVGGTYNTGFGNTGATTNPTNDPVRFVPNFVLTVTSSGYTNTGATTTYVHSVYATHPVRKVFAPNTTPPYPNNESFSSPNVTCTFALSDVIYTSGAGGGDTATASLTGGSSSTCVYSQGGMFSAAASGLTVTNNSTVTYAMNRVIANWSRPGWQRFGNTATVGMVGFHHWAGFGAPGAPLACVKFTITGLTSGQTATQTVVSETIDTATWPGDAVLVPEYVGTLNLSAFTQGENVRVDFVAYPWIGDSSTLMNTNDGVYPRNNGSGTPHSTPYYSSQFGVYDGAGTYGGYFAVVDSINGSDSTGIVSPVAATAAGTPFLTINAAAAGARGIRLYNSASATPTHADCGGGIIYVRYNSGASYAWMGASTAITGSPDTYLTIATYPPDLASGNAILGSQSGNKAINTTTPVLIQNMAINMATAGTAIISTFQDLWVDQCSINSSGAAVFFTIPEICLTRSTVTALGQGIQGFSSTNTSFILIRGNPISNLTIPSSAAYTTLGNLCQSWSSSSSNWTTKNASSGILPLQAIFAYNKMMNVTNNGSQTLLAYGDSTQVGIIGGAFCNNLLEVASGTDGMFYIHGDISTWGPDDNVIEDNNTIVGGRQNGPYDETLNVAHFSRWYSVQNNAIDNINFKADTFGPSMSGTPTVTIAGSPTNTFTRSAGSWVTDGFTSATNTSNIINTSGFSNGGNNGSFTISSVTALTLTCSTAVGLVTEGPVSNTIIGYANANRIGMWGTLFGTGWAGNMDPETTGIGAAGDFCHEFVGLSTFTPALIFSINPIESATEPATYIQYVNRAALSAGGSGAGNGDYHLVPGSPAENLQIVETTLFDLDGLPRSPVDAAGVYRQKPRFDLLSW